MSPVLGGLEAGRPRRYEQKLVSYITQLALRSNVTCQGHDPFLLCFVGGSLSFLWALDLDGPFLLVLELNCEGEVLSHSWP